MTEDVVEDIGLLLKGQREKLGYSLEDASQHTRIRKAYLESIEKNQLDDLPGQAYVTGFIRVYSRYLNLDSNALLSQFEVIQKANVVSSLEPGAVTKLQPRCSSRFAGGEGWNLFVVSFFAVLIVGIAIYFLLSSFQNEGLDEVASNKTLSAKDAVQEQGEAAAEDNQAVQDVISLSQKEEKASVFNEEKAPQRKLLPPVSPEGSSLRILALSESSLIIHVDDRKPHRYELHDGLDLTWKIKDKVKVELSGPRVARFWLGGKELDLGDVDFFQLQSAKDE